MKIKPQDFFIGVIDFFSVILPGGLVSYFLMGQVYGDVFGAGKVFPSPETETQQWIVFLLTTYIAGNIIFLIASLLLDKFVYDKFLRSLFFKKNFDLAYHTASAIRNQYLPADFWINQLIHVKRLKEKEGANLLSQDRREIINTFKWALKFLALKYPETLTDIKKISADSKFFRSLVVAFILMGTVLWWKHQWLAGGCLMVLSFLSLFRYGDLRYKSNQEAYELIVTIHHLEKHGIPDRPATDPAAPVVDNRTAHSPLREEADAWMQRILQLTDGLDATSDVLAIRTGESWRVTNSPNQETLVCLSGKGVAKLGSGGNLEKEMILSPNAMRTFPSRTSFEIVNNQHEPLLLVAVRESAT